MGGELRDGLMKLAFKVVGTMLLLLVLVIVTFYEYLEMTWKRDYSGFASPSLAASVGSATIIRGEYLALDPAFEIVAPNLTPDPETGHITQWTEDDLRSLYRYLRTLAPAKHPVGPTHRAKGSWTAPKA